MPGNVVLQWSEEELPCGFLGCGSEIEASRQTGCSHRLSTSWTPSGFSRGPASPQIGALSLPTLRRAGAIPAQFWTPPPRSLSTARLAILMRLRQGSHLVNSISVPTRTEFREHRACHRLSLARSAPAPLGSAPWCFPLLCAASILYPRLLRSHRSARQALPRSARPAA